MVFTIWQSKTFVIHMAHDLRSSLCGLPKVSLIFIHLFDLIKFTGPRLSWGWIVPFTFTLFSTKLSRNSCIIGLRLFYMYSFRPRPHLFGNPCKHVQCCGPHQFGWSFINRYATVYMVATKGMVNSQINLVQRVFSTRFPIWPPTYWKTRRHWRRGC